MRPCKTQRAIGVLVAIAGLLVPMPALAQIASKPGDAVGTAGGACNSSIMTYGWPDANGNILKCVSNIWQAQGITASAGGSNTQVQYNSSGALAGDSGLTYSNPNLTIGYGSIYIGTSAATSGTLKIGGANGLSYPANDTNCIGCSIAIGPTALTNLPAMPAGSAFYGNVAIGSQAMSSASMTTAAAQNVAIGMQAMKAITGGSTNIMVGDQAGQSLTTGSTNIGIGQGALAYTIVGANNVAVGNQSGLVTTGGSNTYLGTYAGYNVTSGSNNTLIGRSVGQGTLTTGSYNILIGVDATTNTFSSGSTGAVGIGSSVHPGSGDIAIGYQALATNAGDGMGNIAIGSQTLSSASMTTAAMDNVAIGPLVLPRVTSGSGNIAIGYQTGYQLTSGSLNTAVGFQALGAVVSTGSNAAFGKGALFYTSGSNNTGMGTYAGASIHAGSSNTILGFGVANGTLQSGSYNILIGNDVNTDTYSSSTSGAIGIGSSVKPGTGDIAIGYQALNTNAGDSLQNVAIGSQVMSSASMTTAAVQNTAVGAQAMKSVTSGAGNVALGYQALKANTSGSQNIAIGLLAMSSNSTGSSNIAIGRNAEISYNGGSGSNIAIGGNSQQYTSNGTENVSMGGSAIAGYYTGSLATGSYNTAFGSAALYVLTSGNNNTVLGYHVGALTLTSGSNNILIGTNNTVDTPLPGTNNFLNIGNLIYGTSIGTAASPGNVGIGTASPGYSLDTYDSQNASTAIRVRNDTVGSGAGSQFIASYGDNSQYVAMGQLSPSFTTNGLFVGNSTILYSNHNVNGLRIFTFDATNLTFGTNNAANVTIASGGNVGIGTNAPAYLLHVGSATASGTVMELQNSSGACTFAPGTSSLTTTCSSDERLKANIHDTTDALPWLADMRVRDFTVKATGESSTGVIAQEMLVNHPDMVRANSEGFYGVDVPNPWKVIKALQELKAMNDSLKAANDTLQVDTASLKAANDNEATEIKDLRDRLDAIEAAGR